MLVDADAAADRQRRQHRCDATHDFTDIEWPFGVRQRRDVTIKGVGRHAATLRARR